MRDSMIRPKQPTIEDYRLLKQECHDIARPFQELMAEIYALWIPRGVIYNPQDNRMQVLGECHQAEEVRAKMKETIDLYIKLWEEKFGISDVREAVRM